jgi:hypothetical protein
VGVPGASGLNVTSFPGAPGGGLSTAVHWVGAGQATLSSWFCAILTGAPALGACGSNVTTWPSESTAVHWAVDRHVTSIIRPLGSIVTGAGVPGALGSKVTWRPGVPSFVNSTAVHWLVEGHEMLDRKPDPSTWTGVGVPGAVGSKVTALPPMSTDVHWVVDGQATSFTLLDMVCTMQTGCPGHRWACSPGSGVGVGMPGEAGLNVTASLR